MFTNSNQLIFKECVHALLAETLERLKVNLKLKKNYITNRVSHLHNIDWKENPSHAPTFALIYIGLFCASIFE